MKKNEIARRLISSMMKKLTPMLLALVLLSLTTGCANRATALLTPGTNLDKVKSFYVVRVREDENTHELIKKNLTKRGYAVTTGPETSPPYKSDAVITYVDKWMWDITMYMLELSITFRDPANGFPMVVGNSMHASLTRKSPEEMVDEVLTNMFNAK